MAQPWAVVLLLAGTLCTVLGRASQRDHSYVLDNFMVKDRKGELVVDPLSGLPASHRSPSSYTSCRNESDSEVHDCRRWPDGTMLSVRQLHSVNCVEFVSHGVNSAYRAYVKFDEGLWYGGNEEYVQKWPLNKNDDGLQLPLVTASKSNRAIVDGLWFSSTGQLVYLHPGAPAFLLFNITGLKGMLGLRFAMDPPFRQRPDGVWIAKYSVCNFGDAREAFKHAVSNFVARPTGIPDERMITHPVWSTWARYKTDINDTVVRDFARQIKEHGFTNSQLEIDNAWETCYGSKEVDTTRFPDLKKLVDDLHADGFRVTLWSHPFVQSDCAATLAEAKAKGYLVKGQDGGVQTKWWNGDASIIDFTNKEAADWFVAKHKKLMCETCVDGFKFDAGETSWNPQLPDFHDLLAGSHEVYPNLATTRYAQTCARFNGLTEVRSAYHTQSLPVFVRMIDKDSRWGEDNGLKSVVTTLLQMNMVGYTLVLPDIIGGNEDNGEKASEELFIRWLQANTFMPAMRYARVPWDYSQKTVEIACKFNNLHAKYSEIIVKAMNRSVEDGTPVNPPIWWVDPKNEEAQQEDSAFLLGENLLVAPVLRQGATKRDVHLPAGYWRDANDPNGAIHPGPITLRDYPAPIAILPWFVRAGSDCDHWRAADSAATAAASAVRLVVAAALLAVLRQYPAGLTTPDRTDCRLPPWPR